MQAIQVTVDMVPASPRVLCMLGVAHRSRYELVKCTCDVHASVLPKIKLPDIAETLDCSYHRASK